MVKRIFLAFLFIFTPLVSSNAEIIVNNMDEKYIPLDLDIMKDSFEIAFERIVMASNKNPFTLLDKNRVQDKFYTLLYDNYSAPFSLRDLIDACRKGVGKSRATECVDFARLYVNKINEKYIPSRTTTEITNPDGSITTVESTVYVTRE